MFRKLLRKIFQRRRDRTITKYHRMIQAFSSLSPEVDALPSAERVMVLAPHCDDETAGCGGTLLKYSRGNARITAVFLTDGSQCESSLGKADLIALRREEAEKAGGLLGIREFVFLDFPDGGLGRCSGAAGQLSRVIERTRPGVILLPFFLDNHPDHRATADILAEAVRGHPPMPVLFYEIWSAMIPNLLSDVSDVMDKKLEALRCYRSQVSIGRIEEQVKSLNRYRALTLQKPLQYAEGFFKMNSRGLGDLPGGPSGKGFP